MFLGNEWRVLGVVQKHWHNGARLAAEFFWREIIGNWKGDQALRQISLGRAGRTLREFAC
jgi:hypothetical protein